MKGLFGKGGVTQFERDIIANVENYGCHINWVHDFEGPEPSFAYSVGFTHSLGAPEVILFGLPKETSFDAINLLFAQCRDGLVLAEGAKVSNLFRTDYTCVLRTVDESWLIQSYFASALWYHRTQMRSALTDVMMIVWPDADHRFPWQQGCADWVQNDQPILYMPRVNS